MRRHVHDRQTRVPDRDQVMYDNWTYLKDPVKERWNRLSDMRLEQIDGHHDRLVDHIQVVYGIHRDDAEAQVEEFMNDYTDYFRLVSERAPSTPLTMHPGP